MKKDTKIIYIFLIILIILFYLIYGILFSNKGDGVIIHDYIDEHYILSSDERNLLIERLNGIDIFSKYKGRMKKDVKLMINTDDRDWKAWGEVIFYFDKECKPDLEKMLQNTGISLMKDNGLTIFGVKDKYGNIFVEKDYTDEKKVNLIFQITLPYRYNFDKHYNKYIDFFLKFQKLEKNNI